MLPLPIVRCLERLARYVIVRDVALTGSAAIAIHASANGLERVDPIGDLDFVARDVARCASGIAPEFLISHYHREPAARRALLQLADPETRVRVDIFPDMEDACSRAARTTIGATSWAVLTCEDILEHKLRTLRRSSPNDPVDPKHVRDAALVAGLVGRSLPTQSLHLASRPLSRDLQTRCDRCRASEDSRFPLAPKQRIFDILGYV